MIIIISVLPALTETFQRMITSLQSSWGGEITDAGGLVDKMYKVFTTYQQPLTIKGVPVIFCTWVSYSNQLE
jgi:hypothetical protein